MTGAISISRSCKTESSRKLLDPERDWENIEERCKLRKVSLKTRRMEELKVSKKSQKLEQSLIP